MFHHLLQDNQHGYPGCPVFGKVLAMIILLFLFSHSASHAGFQGGTGTKEDPFQIASIDDFQLIRNHLDRHFIQVQNFDASYENDFFPVGDFRNPFRGSYDGAGLSISNLSITFCPTCGVSSSGLFGVVDGGEVKNVTLLDVFITETENVGALVGYNKGTIINSCASGTVSGRNNTGGLVGYNDGKIFTSCANVDVSGTRSVGGLAGLNSGTIRDCYAKGSVTGDEETGGLVGANLTDALIAASFACGKVEKPDEAGGLVGFNRGTIESGYWDRDSSSREKGVGQGNDTGTTGLNTTQMTGISAFETMSQLDFGHTWLLTPDYPALFWQDVETIELPSSTENPEKTVSFQLYPNYPNPFNATTLIRFSLAETSHVKLEIFTLQGQPVELLVSETRSAGMHSVRFNAGGHAAGVYLCRIRVNGVSESRKMLFLP